MTHVWRALVNWSASGALLAAAPVLAEPPAAEPAVHIEQWRGLRCVVKDCKSAEHAKPAVITLASPALQGLPPVLLPKINPPPLPQIAPNLPFVPAPAPMPAPVPVTVPAAIPIRLEIHTERVHDDPPAKSGAKAPEADAAEAQSAEVINSRVLRPILPEPREESWVSTLATLMGGILTPLVVMGSVLMLLRHLRRNPLIRIEHVGSQNLGGAQQSFSLTDVVRILQGNLANPISAQDHAPSAEPPSTAVPFELGPTFEEERLAREQQAQQKQEGLLRQLFEDNVKLQTELKNSAPDTVLA
jgi:hypothetical protein